MSGTSRRWATAAAAFALLVGMVALSRDFGFTWDERFQQRYGEQIWDYLRGRLARSTFDTDEGNQYLYGGLVELACVAAQHVIRADVYVVRHGVIAVFGWLGIVFSGLLAARFWGARAGWLAAALLTLAPRYFGDAMNNPKDAPFAALAVMAVYYTLAIAPRPPHLSWSQMAKLGLAVALAINVRPLGLALLAYAGLVFVAVALASAVATREVGWRHLGFDAIKFAVMAAVAVPAGTLAWPWAQGNPFVRPIEGFLIASRLDWAAGFPTLYQGEYVAAGSLPWHYIPVWLAISTPPVVLAGLALSLLICRPRASSRPAALAIAVFVLAPVAAAIIRGATIYDGIRHLLFILPPLTVLSAVGWTNLIDLQRARSRTVALAVLVLVFVLGAAEPLLFQIRNHPNQIVYFSPLAGGPRAAFLRYEMDYWANSVLQAVNWTADIADQVGAPVVISGNPPQAVEADAGRHRSLSFARPQSQDYYFDIRLLRGPPGSVREFAERPDVLYRVTTADGTPLSVVIPGPAYQQWRQWLESHGRPLP